MNSSPNADAKPLENRFVLDASALLASILREPGADAVDEAMRAGSFASTINEAEALSRLVDLGFLDRDAEDALGALEYVPVEFTPEHAVRSGRMRLPTRQFGLGLGDRACLALAASLNLPVMTADRIWTQLDVGVEVVLCR
jgi:PIN domain nuclease of toxin-antitoxin system